MICCHTRRAYLNWVPHGSVLGLLLFNIFINDLETGVESMFIKLSNDTKLGGVARTLKGRIRRQNLDKLENWSEFKEIKLNRDKCKYSRRKEKIKYKFKVTD